MPTYIPKSTIYDRVNVQPQISPDITASISPKKTPSIVFKELSDAAYEQASPIQTPKNTRETLTFLGTEIKTSPEFALLSTKDQQTYLLALDHLQERDNPLRNLITKCRILLRSLIYWAAGLPENKRIHILDILKRASDCLALKTPITEDDARKLYTELRDVQQKISKLSKLPFQEFDNLLQGLNVTVAKIRNKSAYERLKQKYEAIRLTWKNRIQETLHALPPPEVLQEKTLLASFEILKPMLKLYFTKEFFSCAQRRKEPPPSIKNLLEEHTLKAFNDRSEQEQAAVKEFLTNRF